MSQNWNYKLLSEQILFLCHKGTVHSKLKTCWKCAHSQVIQDVDEFVSSSDLEKCSITSVSQQWILCSEWVPSEWEPNLSQILSYHNKPYINGKLIYSAFMWCINLNFEKLTLMTGFVVSCLDFHSDGNHSLQRIHCWDSDAIRIRIRMSFIGQVCLHIRGICYSDKAPQCNRMTATGQDTDNKRTIYKYTNRQCTK